MKDWLKQFAVVFLAGAGAVASPAVFAHTFGAHGAGFAEGFAHPFSGLDHLLVMLAVGLWAAQMGGAFLWRLPLAFLAAMAGGALLSSPLANAGWVEPALGATVVGMGLMLAFAVRLPAYFALLAVGLFAVFHGFAHGLEAPQAALPMDYALGFLSATACLHGIGVFLGLALSRFGFTLRAGGVAIAIAGAWVLSA